MSCKTNINKISDFMKQKWELSVKPKLILSVLNSNLKSETNKDTVINGIIKTVMDSGIYT